MQSYRPFARRRWSVFALGSVGCALAMTGEPAARGSVVLYGQTWYSTNTGLTNNAGSLQWATPAGANSEMHTHFAPVSLAVGETMNVTFNLRFSEPQGDGGNSADDGIRMGVIDVTTQSNTDGAKTATTGDGYRYRFNWEAATNITGGIAHERTPTGSNAAYLTSSGGVWDQSPLNINGFGLNADGAVAYPVTFSVTRTAAADATASLTINGVTRTYADPGDGAFTYDTFALAKIGDAGAFTEAATFTLTDFAVNVVPVPEPASLGLLGVGAAGLLARRRRQA